MDSLDMIQIPTLKFLSSSSTNPSSGNSALPKTINKIVKKKLYKRSTKRTSSTSSSPRRSNTRKTFSAYRDRRQKWKQLYDKDGWKLQELFGKRRSRKTITSSDSTPSSARSSTPYTPNRSTSTISHEESLSAPGSRQSPIFIDSDDDESPSTPSPIRKSPSYGRNTRQTRINSNGTAPSPPIVYPKLPTETPAAHFMLLYPKPLDDSTIDRKLIDEIRKGPTAEVRDRELCMLYTAALKGEDRYVKIGYTEDLQKRISALSSPRGSGTIYSLDDFTPGAQSRFLNCHHAEKIIHLELYNRRHRFIEKNQTEWFELEVDEAHRVCRKWRNWFRLWAPYDQNLQLNAFWRRRIDQIDPYDAAKHGSLHQRWSRVLNLSWWDRIFYKPIIILDALYQWWTWLCENPLYILAVQMLVSFIIYALYGPLSLFLTAASVLLLWSGLSKQTTGKTRKTRKRGPD